MAWKLLESLPDGIVHIGLAVKIHGMILIAKFIK